MKKYVIMAFAITGIGGAQIYYNNKKKYCEQNGWGVYVFSGYSGDMHIKELSVYENLIKEDILEYPYFLPKKKINKIINWMLKSIDYHVGDEVVVESSNVVLGMWGELFAKACNGRNLLYNLDERLCARNKSVYNFLEFKLNRGELRCIKAKIMHSCFSQRTLPDDHLISFKALCTNSMENVVIPKEINLNIDTNRPVIGILGRISKPYVYTALYEVIKFSEKHKDEFFNILIVGGGEKSYYTKLVDMVKNIPNVRLTITGEIYPIPQKIIEKMTVAIGSSGSIRLPCSLDIPSISVEINSQKALGFLEYDTQNTQFALNGEKTRFISDCLEDFFYNSYLNNRPKLYPPVKIVTQEEITENFDNHFKYLEMVDSLKVYFSDFIACGIKEKTIKLLYRIFGRKFIALLKK